jgi:hypothetical protein
MAGTIIQIKRTTTGNIPSSTEQGELFYVYGGNTGSAGSQSNGHRLFIGDPTTNTNTPIKIGGDYYTALMDHDHGTLTANAGIIVDNNKAIDELFVGNNSTIGGSIKFNEGTNNGSNYVALKASDSLTSSITFRLPESHAASNGQALVADTSGNLSFASVGGTLDIAADSGTDNGVVVGTDTLTISGGTGINTSVSGDVITVNGDIATTSAVGVASFATADFGVTVGGEVSLNDAVVKSITTDTGGMTPATHAFSILGGEGIDVTHTGTTISVIGEDASDTNKGVASFASADFTVASGAVTIKTGGVSNGQLANSSITFGSTAVSLGDTVTSLSDVTSISTTSGDLTLNPFGTVNVSGKRITGVGNPTADSDAATKEYVDAVAEGLHVHESVVAATTDSLANLSSQTVTYSNGASGVGATLSIGGTNALTAIDGVTLSNDDRVLVKNESTTAHNGIYTYNNTAGTIVFTRANDFNTFEEVAGGDFLFVTGGTSYDSTGWVQTETVATIGSDSIVFSQFSGVGSFTAGNGLDLIGSEFSVVGTTNRISVSASGVDIASTYVGQTSITTLGTIATGTWNGTEIGVAYGGTGITTTPQGSVLISNTLDTFSALDGGSTITATNDVGVLIYSQATDTVSWSNTIDGGTY